MEKTMNNNFIKLLLNSIKNKRNWFYISTVIMLVSTILIPYILRDGYDAFVGLGIVEVFIIVFINCMIDNSFLHSDSKLAYYKSKPVSIGKQVYIHIATNLILAAYLLALVLLSVAVNHSSWDLLEAFKVFIPWLAVGILLASLSSILTGNTIMAGIMTIFNFALPAIFYLILNFVFTILEDMVNGFSANVFMEYFVNTIYKLDYIYFLKYARNNEAVDYVYVLLLGAFIAAISLLIRSCIKRRKNENTGSFMVFDGYKYFVSVLASLIIPAFFSITSYRNTAASKISVSIILAGLSFYILIAIMEKSFRISRLSIKVFTASMALFTVVMGGSVAVANQYKNAVPDVADVKAAYVGSNIYFTRSPVWKEYIKAKDQAEYSEDLIEWQRNNGIVLFFEKENIEKVTELHREMIVNKEYGALDMYYYSRVSIVYLMNDGRVMIREYKGSNEQAGTSNNKKDAIAHALVNSSEFKKTKFSYLYDKQYYEGKNIFANIVSERYNGEIRGDSVKIDDIREYLIKDIDRFLYEMDDAYSIFLNYNYEKIFYKDGAGENYEYRLEVYDLNGKDDTNHIDNLPIYKTYTNTLEYLNPMITQEYIKLN